MINKHETASQNSFSKIGDSRRNPDGSLSTLVDNGDGSIGTLTTGCPKVHHVYLHKRTGIISSVPEPEVA